MEAGSEPTVPNALPQPDGAKYGVLECDADRSRAAVTGIRRLADLIDAEAIEDKPLDTTSAMGIAELLRGISDRVEREFSRLYSAHGIKF